MQKGQEKGRKEALLSHSLFFLLPPDHSLFQAVNGGRGGVGKYLQIPNWMTFCDGIIFKLVLGQQIFTKDLDSFTHIDINVIFNDKYSPHQCITA